MEDLIKALQILSKYCNDCDNPTHCEHDILYITSEVDPDTVLEEDIEKLDNLGFFIDEELGIFASFRFGSC